MAIKEYTIEAGKTQKNIKTNSNPLHTSLNIENLSKSDDGRIRITSTSFPMEEDFIDPASSTIIKKKYDGKSIEISNLGKTTLKIKIE